MKSGDIETLGEIIARIKRYEASHRPASTGKSGRRPRNDDHSKPRLHEPQTKAVMIEPILAWLGWGGQDDPDSLWREFPVYSGQVDYACRIGGLPCLTIECKKPDVDLRDGKVAAQACGYAYEANAPYAAASNGLVWVIYKTLADARPTDKLVRKIDLKACSTEDAFQFFKHLTKDRAMAGALSIPAAPAADAGKARKAAAKKARRKAAKARNRRASLNSPAIRPHVASVAQTYVGGLIPVDGSRNTMRSADGDRRIRFCASGGTEPMFNLSPDHLDVEKIYLVQDGVPHGWMIPAALLKRYFLDGGMGERKSWTFKVSCAEDGDMLWINKNLPALSLTQLRHQPGHA